MMKNRVFNSTEVNPESSIQCREFFNDKWKLYQKVLTYNYMKHQEIYDVLHHFLIGNWQQQFKVLDLGCGDASFIAKALQNNAVSYYLGLDLSDIAIAIARQNLQVIPCTQEFIQGDFLKVIPLLVKEPKNQFDIILTSFAFHHLKLEEKDDLLSQIKQLLLPGGIFILIDFVVQEGESREIYIHRYLQNVRQQWQQLTDAEAVLVFQHMLESDYPETQATLEFLALKNEFQRVETLYQHEQTSQLCCFYS
jgi:SAM-dependent methyltransferase